MNEYWKQLFERLDRFRRDVKAYADQDHNSREDLVAERWRDEQQIREEESGSGNSNYREDGNGNEEEQLGNNGERIKQYPEDDWRKDR